VNNLLPIFVAGCGLLFSVLGAWGLLSTFRTSSGLGPARQPTSESSQAVKANVHTFLRMKRRSGILWLCLGVATLWISSDRDSWGVPTLGLLWGAMVYFMGFRLGASPTVVSQPRAQNGRLAEIVTQHVERAFEQNGHIGLVVGAIAKDEEMLLGFGARQVGDSHLGLIVGAIAKDEEMLLGYGPRQLGDSQPPDADTVFEIGSISKVFTGILLAQRIENGELELDDRIAELLPEGWSLSESASEITLRHCTTHTSGFPRLPANLLGISGMFNLAFVGGDPYRDYSEEDFRDALATVELKFDPGTECRYSNFAVGLLGFVLATQNGSDYETLVTSKIFQPLGMHRTVITNNEWHREHMPAKYRAVCKLGPVRVTMESDEWQFPNHLAGAGAIRSTGRDMMTFLKANMGLIPTPIDEAIRRSHQELFEERTDRAMGMNWIRSFESNISQNIIWHNGGTGGFRTYLGFTEDRQFGVFVLSNTAISVDALAEGILKALVREDAPGIVAAEDKRMHRR
jgi:CubicO group peptidase (beta-lactamase class C family)